MSKQANRSKSTITNYKPVPGIIHVNNVTPQEKLNKFMLNNPNIRISPVVIPDQKYDPFYQSITDDITQNAYKNNRVFSPVNIPKPSLTKKRTLSDMENARKSSSSPQSVKEYITNLDDSDLEYDKDEWGHHSKSFFGGLKNRTKNKKNHYTKNKKNRSTKKKLRNKKRQTRRKKQK